MLPGVLTSGESSARWWFVLQVQGSPTVAALPGCSVAAESVGSLQNPVRAERAWPSHRDSWISVTTPGFGAKVHDSSRNDL